MYCVHVTCHRCTFHLIPCHIYTYTHMHIPPHSISHIYIHTYAFMHMHASVHTQCTKNCPYFECGLTGDVLSVYLKCSRDMISLKLYTAMMIMYRAIFFFYYSVWYSSYSLIFLQDGDLSYLFFVAKSSYFSFYIVVYNWILILGCPSARTLRTFWKHHKWTATREWAESS